MRKLKKVKIKTTNSNERQEEPKKESKGESKEEPNLIEKQKENTESHVKEANKEDVEIPDVLKEVPLNASNALEEYLALKLINDKKKDGREIFRLLMSVTCLFLSDYHWISLL